MKFLLDENQSQSLVALLTDAGHDVVHVRDVGAAGIDDHEVLQMAASQGRVIVSADTDFGALLASSHAALREACGRQQSTRREREPSGQ